MTTARAGPFLIDRGAQFLSTGYRIIPALAASLRLEIEPTASPRSAIYVDRRLHMLRPDRPMDALTSGLMRATDIIRTGAIHWRYRKALAAGDLGDYSAWAPFDTQAASDWIASRGGTPGLERVFEPLLEGLYFQQPETTSKALALMVSAFSWRRERTTTLRGGMGALPTAIAKSLDIRLDETVVGVRAVADGVEVDTPDGIHFARHVICAVPAPVARGLRPDAAPDESDLLQTPYSASINVALMTNESYSLPRDLQDTYGILVARPDRVQLAAIAIEANKCKDRAGTGHLFNVMLSDGAARARASLSDADLLAGLRPDVERFLPGVWSHLQSTAIFRWPEAEPRSPVGRAKAISRYRTGSARTSRVLLAGDYLAAPYTEGAAASGLWAANELLSRL